MSPARAHLAIARQRPTRSSEGDDDDVNVNTHDAFGHEIGKTRSFNQRLFSGLRLGNWPPIRRRFYSGHMITELLIMMRYTAINAGAKYIMFDGAVM